MEKKAKKEKVEYYTLRPNLKQYYGKRVNKETEFTDKTEDGTVTQEFKDLTLTTHIKRETESGEFKIMEDTTLKVIVPEGTILIWDEKEGFILPQYQFCDLDTVKEDIKDMEDIYKQED